jgi:hypothetical protein
MQSLEEEIDQTDTLGFFHPLLWSDRWIHESNDLCAEFSTNGMSPQAADWQRQVHRKIWTKRMYASMIVIALALSVVAVILWITIGMRIGG